VGGKRLDLAGEELGDGGLERGLVAVVLVGREVGERIRAGKRRRERCLTVDQVGGPLQLARHVAREVEVVDDPWVAVEVVVVVPDDPAGLDAVVHRQRMRDHVVPTPLSLDHAVEAGVELVVDVLGAHLVVLLDDRLALVAAQQVTLLVTLQVGERLLLPSPEAGTAPVWLRLVQSLPLVRYAVV